MTPLLTIHFLGVSRYLMFPTCGSIVLTWRIIPCSKWFIAMVIVSPRLLGLRDPFQMAFSWLVNGGDPNYLLTGMILQVGHLRPPQWPPVPTQQSCMENLPSAQYARESRMQRRAAMSEELSSGFGVFGSQGNGFCLHKKCRMFTLPPIIMEVKNGSL